MKVLTAKDGEIPISDDLRSILAFLDDGRLIVSRSHRFNPHVRGFAGRLKYLGRDYILQEADLEAIAKLYENAVGSEKHSNMQATAKSLFTRAVEKRASDIHIRVSVRDRSQILFRIHNDLTFIEEHPYEYGNQLCTTIYQAMADVSDATFEQLSRQDARISKRSSLPEAIDGIRIATSPQVDGYIMVLRLLYNDTSNDLNLVRLGFSPEHISCIELMKRKPTGAVLIAGPTGSGKSTTLQRVLGSIIQETGGRKHIITVEDPPEYPIKGAVQTPVTNADSAEDRSREYQKAIKAAMRLDPDIIMLSEIRDAPSGSLGIQASMTGHQVWSTIHANNAIGVIGRLIDLGVNESQVTDPTIVAGLISQRLVKQLCPHCKQPLADHMHEFEQRTIDRFMQVLNLEDVYVQSSDGCEHCANSGTIGRTVVAETIIPDEKLMDLLRANKRMEATEYLRKELKVMSMLEHAIQKINAGLIDPLQAEDVVGPLAEMVSAERLALVA
jgi:general secretion pathway protein E